MESIIGVIGTILGTILGWILNSLSKMGNLKVFISEWHENFKYNELGTMVPSNSKEQTQSFDYKLTIDLYNSSGDTKIMRDICIVFSDYKTVLHKSIPKDESTKRTNSHFSFFDEVGPINVPPKNITQLKLHDGSWFENGGLDYIWKTKSIHLSYVDEKGNIRKILIIEKNYSCEFHVDS